MSVVSRNSVHSFLGTIDSLRPSVPLTGDRKAKLNRILSVAVKPIWANGLDSARLDVLVDIFVYNDLNAVSRKLILDCLVPQEKLSQETWDKMVLWMTSHCISSSEETLFTLQWMKAMIRYGFVDAAMFDGWYNIIIKYLAYPALVSSVSEILHMTAHRQFMTKSNVNFLERKYEDNQNKFIRRILWEYAQHVPHLVNKAFHLRKPSVWDTTRLTDFEEAVKSRGSVRDFSSSGNVLNPRIPIEYDENPETEDFKKIGDVGSMMELGRSLNTLKLPLNELSLLQSEEGIMFIVVNKPSLNFLQSLGSALSTSLSDTLIEGVSGLQELLTFGLPPVTNFLTKFLKAWDGNFKSEYVFSLLPRIYFYTFEELDKNILIPLMRVFVTEDVHVKIRILQSLLNLIVNVTAEFTDETSTSDRYGEFIRTPEWLEYGEGTVASLIECADALWFIAIASEGFHCTELILQCLFFYRTINTLVVKCKLPFFYVIRPCYSSAALMSKNCLVLEELCKLILSYKKEVIPALERQGFLGEFELEIEAVMAMADSTFKYIWEKVGGERPTNFHTTQDEFTPTESIGVDHMALYPILNYLSKELKRNIRSLTKREILNILDSLTDGVAEFIRYEETDQLTHTH